MARTIDKMWAKDLTELVVVNGLFAERYTLQDQFCHFAADVNLRLLTPLVDKVLDMDLHEAGD